MIVLPGSVYCKMSLNSYQVSCLKTALLGLFQLQNLTINRTQSAFLFTLVGGEKEKKNPVSWDLTVFSSFCLDGYWDFVHG